MISYRGKVGFSISFAVLISLPGFSLSQTVDGDASRQEYWCSLAKVSAGYEGQDRYTKVEDDERKPTVITVPLTDKEAVIHEDFSEDGRFFSYIRFFTDQDDKYVLHGVFDLQLERLSTSSSYLALGNDDILRPISRNNVWSCTIKE